jgi:hypothetical protein
VPFFRGSVRNGVTTSSYRTWPRSYSFVADAAPGRITWDTVWSNVPAGLTTQVALECPQGGPATGGVWGTMVYTGGSSICTAAVHAGAITVARGGSIEVRRSVHSGEFVGSLRNGVTSQAWSSQSEAFSVSGAASSVLQVPATGSAGLSIGDPATIRNPNGAMQASAVLPALATAVAVSGPRTVVTLAFTRVGAGIAATDVVLKLPLNLTGLSPTIRKVQVVCEVIPVGRAPAGSGGTVVPVVDAQYVGTVEVYVPARGGIAGFSTGTSMRYYCFLVAIDAADQPFVAGDLAQATIRGDFTW